MHWSDQQQQRQEQQQQQQSAPQLPLEMAAADDNIDVLEACDSHAQQAQWRHIWATLGSTGFFVCACCWQLDVWGLQSIHWQGHASTGQLSITLNRVWWLA